MKNVKTHYEDLNHTYEKNLEGYRKYLEEEKVRAEFSLKHKRAYLRVPEGIKELFLQQAELIKLERNRPGPFVIDDDNREVITELAHYFTGYHKSKLDLNKGILLIGGFGTGKTLILKTFANMVNNLTSKRITIMHSKQLPQYIMDPEIGIDWLLNRPLLLDDLGKEPKTIKHFGSEIQPAVDLLSQRYDSGAWTFATANYSLESFSEFYGQTISSRFVEMFNVVELTGKDRRSQPND